MQSQKGYSLIVLVITIIVLIILIAIVINPSTQVLEETEKNKEITEAAIDNDKIEEIITYELAGTPELIDIEIDLKRLELSDSIQVVNNAIFYGEGWVLYLCKRDIPKVERKTDTEDYYKDYKEITRSYVVNTITGEYVRLEYQWDFAN